MLYIVTVRIKRNITHNSIHKKTGRCPLTGKACTDITGEHHSMVVEAKNIGHLRKKLKDFHITRIEEL
jgi:hypothetical protein